MDKYPNSPQARPLSQGFYLGIKTYNNAGHLFQVYQGVLQMLLIHFLVVEIASLALLVVNITLVNGHCLPKLFPFNLAFHSTLKNICLTGSGVGGDAPSPSSPLGANQIVVSKLSLPMKLHFQRLLGNRKQDIAKCWSSLSSINWCIDEIYGTLSRGKFGVDSHACCLSIGVVSNQCWPKMFPFNLLFPQLLKSKCGFKAAPKSRRIWSCLWIWRNSSLAAVISKCIGQWLRENVVFS